MLLQHYDLGKSPPTCDFLHWLANVERHRRQSGEKHVFINFVLGERLLSPRDQAFPAARKAARLHQMLVPLCRALSSYAGYSVGHWGEQEIKYQPQPPLNEVFFDAPEDARAFIAHWIFSMKPIATITLRQSDFQTKRNSNVTELQKVADYLASCNYEVIVIPDSENLTHNKLPGITGHRLCELAAANPLYRLALYQAAAINLFGSVGMYALALYSGANFLQVNTVFPDIPLANEEAQRLMGLGPDSLLNPHQRICWVPETYEAIVEELSRGDFLNLALKRERPIREIATMAASSNEKRIENIRNAVAVCKKRVVPPKESHDRKFILAAAGPTLENTWPQLAKLASEKEADLFTTSIAHDFLIARGVIPYGHVASDPRENQADFTKTPHPQVRYFPASCCHPAVFESLKDADVYLWHAFEGDEIHQLVREIDKNSVLVLGGSNVGLRALALGTTLGYRDFHLFGMDCSFSDEAEPRQHAAKHSGKPHKVIEVRVAGRAFKTSPAMIVSAREFSTMLEYVKGCTFTLYGEGMLNHMMQEALRSAPKAAEVANPFTGERKAA